MKTTLLKMTIKIKLFLIIILLTVLNMIMQADDLLLLDDDDLKEWQTTEIKTFRKKEL